MEDKIKVLLVDDEPDFLVPIAFWLNSKGYEVAVASSGEKAIDMLKKEKKPHIVFLDINMPGMDGLETLKRIRKMDRELPVIMVTAYADEEKFSQAKKLKTSGFFPKGGSLEELQKTIEVTLRTLKKLKMPQK
ncbi:MAG: response regulator [Candidatus Omnitrophica bacterium]|nr:response regulator [Candidatus Omnitrophota bacterium]